MRGSAAVSISVDKPLKKACLGGLMYSSDQSLVVGVDLAVGSLPHRSYMALALGGCTASVKVVTWRLRGEIRSLFGL